MTDLTPYDQSYNDAEVPEDGFSTIPDGKYQAMVSAFYFNPVGEYLFLVWELMILNGEYEGRNIRKSDRIDANTIQYRKKEIQICQIDIEKFSDLETDSTRARFLDINLEIQISTRTSQTTGKKYTNIYINKRLDVVESNNDGTPF